MVVFYFYNISCSYSICNIGNNLKFVCHVSKIIFCNSYFCILENNTQKSYEHIFRFKYVCIILGKCGQINYL